MSEISFVRQTLTAKSLPDRTTKQQVKSLQKQPVSDNCTDFHEGPSMKVSRWNFTEFIKKYGRILHRAIISVTWYPERIHIFFFLFPNIK